MRKVSLAMLIVLVFCGPPVVGEDGARTTTPVDQTEQINSLTVKLEELEKRMAALEEENQLLRENLRKLNLVTEVGIPFDVERAMIGEEMFRSNQSGQFRFQDQYEYRVEPGTIVVPPKK